MDGSTISPPGGTATTTATASVAADRAAAGGAAAADHASGAAIPSPASPDAGRPGAARVAACWISIAAVLPYLTLKLIWLSGHPVGVLDQTAVGNRTLEVLNAATLLMDAVAAFCALVLTYGWGRRLPGWLVAVPMWVGSGLLGGLVIFAPVQVLADALVGRHSFAGGFLRPWVYETVYAGFIVQGIGLMTAFALYSRARWSSLWQSPMPMLMPTPASSPTHAAPDRGRIALATLSALGAIPLLYWGIGGGVGLPAEVAAAQAHRLVALELARGLAALTLALGIIWTRSAAGPRALVAVWTGSAITATWGAWTALMGLLNSPVSGAGRAAGVAQIPTVAIGLTQAALGVAAIALTLRTLKRRAEMPAPTGPAKIEA